MKKSYQFLLSIIILLFLSFNIYAQSKDAELFSVAQKAFEDGFYDVSSRYINQLLDQYPQTDKRIQAKLLLGQCFFFQTQYVKAFEVFQELLKYSEHKDATLFWLGETYLKGSDYKQAQKQYQQLIELFPNSMFAPQAYYSLGWSYFEQNLFESAKKTFLMLLQFFPSHQLTEDAAFKLGEIDFNLQNHKEAIEAFDKYLQTYPGSSRQAQAFFYIAESYYSLEDYLTAITYYAKAANLTYDENLIIMCKVSMGWGYLKLGKTSLSAESFDEALKIAQEKNIMADDIYLGQASLYLESGEQEKALKAYSNLIDNAPESPRLPQSYLGKANILYQTGDFPQAIKTYQELIHKFQEKKDYQEIIEKAFFGLAWSYLKSNDFESCIKTFETIKNNARSPIIEVSAMIQIADAYQDINKFEEAISIYDKILKGYPRNPYTDYVQYRLGIALLKMDRLDAAALSFQSLQTNFPDSRYVTDTKYYLAVTYIKKEDWRAAKDQILEFIKMIPRSHEFLADAYYLLALAYYNLEEYAESIKISETIIKNYPTQIDLIKNAELNAAKCYYKIKDMKESLKRFKSLIDTAPKTEAGQEALIWLGDYYFESRDFEKAIEYYMSFVSQFPSNDKINFIRYQLGQALQLSDKLGEAINILKTIDKEDKNLFAKASLIIANIFSKDLEPQKAIATYESIIATSPEFKRDAYARMAGVYKNNNDFSKAIEFYEKALNSEKESSQSLNPELQFNIADAYQLSNKQDKAIEEYLKIPYLYPKETLWIIKSYLRIGRIFEDAEKWEEANTIYNKIIKLGTEESKFAQERIDWIKENARKKK
ncbi:MAG TPA: tetratricopeptide repeat protein [Candidatus Omnitrophota bacterium]|nr:tetratricopeptide repeat protein [Candidatus Omnitrophota bacterium]